MKNRIKNFIYNKIYKKIIKFYQYYLTRIQYYKQIKKINLNNPKKIVLVTHSLDYTGAPMLLINIAKHFKNHGYEVITLSLEKEKLKHEYLKYNLPLILLNKRLILDSSIYLHNVNYVAKKLSKIGFKNVLINTTVSGIIIPPFFNYNFNIISLVHEMKTSIEFHNFFEGARNIAKYSNYIIFPSNIVKNDFYELNNFDIKKSIIKHQGLYMKNDNTNTISKEMVFKKYNIPLDSRLILVSGNFTLRKGADLCVQSFQKINSITNKKYHLIWAGNNESIEMSCWLKHQIQKSNLLSNYHLAGFIKDKDEYISLLLASDIFWLTSREDPFPSVIIEAVHNKIPVVAFKSSGGADELLSDGRGILIENFDTAEFAYKTEELLNNPITKEIMIKKSKEFLNKSSSFEEYFHFLENLLI